MTKKEKIELLLTKVTEEEKEAFVTELREVKTQEAMLELLKKFNINLTDEEKEAMKPLTNEISEEELVQVAGGCCTSRDGTPCTGCS